MCCFILLALLAMPRLLVFFMFFQNYINRAYQTMLWPLLGFFFMPWTTAAYAVCMNEWDGVRDGGVVLIVVAILFDLGIAGASARKKTRRNPIRQE